MWVLFKQEFYHRQISRSKRSIILSDIFMIRVSNSESEQNLRKSTGLLHLLIEVSYNFTEILKSNTRYLK